MASLELSLVFECLWQPLMRSSLPTWLSQQPSDLSGFKQDSPQYSSCSFPFELLFRMVHAYCILCIYCILFAFCIPLCFPMIHRICSNVLLNYFNNQLLPIIIIDVRLLFIIMILEMYSRYFDHKNPLTSNIYDSLNIIYRTTTFFLA
jgi:hypothetical protein